MTMDAQENMKIWRWSSEVCGNNICGKGPIHKYIYYITLVAEDIHQCL